jgi:hypothetical protein
MAIDRKAYCRFILRAGLAMVAAVPQLSLAQSQESIGSSRKTNRGEGSWRLSIGANYSRGDYGETIDTKVASFPVALRYSKNRVRLRVSVPYIILSGPGSLLDRGEGGGVDVGDGDLRAERHQGIGDVSVQAGYLLPLGSGLSLNATGRVKLPTASRAKRLGTGKVDVTAGLELVKNLKGASLYVGGRRRFVGEPDGANLRDVWGVSAGGNVRAAKGLSLGLDYSWRQSSRIGGGDISEVSGWANVRLNRRLRLTIFGGTGLTQNSSDLIAGTSLSYRL